MKYFFVRHGPTEVGFSDDGSKFLNLEVSEFQKFVEGWGFQHKTSSPRYPQSKGFVEAAAGIIKQSLKKTGESYVALQTYHSTPLNNGYSPSVLLMEGRLRTSLPAADSALQPKQVDKDQINLWEECSRKQQKCNYD